MDTGVTTKVFGTNQHVIHANANKYIPRYNVSSDGSTWEGDKLVNDTLITGSPSAIVFKDSIYCFYQGVGELQNKLLVNR